MTGAIRWFLEDIKMSQLCQIKLNFWLMDNYDGQFHWKHKTIYFRANESKNMRITYITNRVDNRWAQWFWIYHMYHHAYKITDRFQWHLKCNYLLTENNGPIQDSIFVKDSILNLLRSCVVLLRYSHQSYFGLFLFSRLNCIILSWKQHQFICIWLIENASLRISAKCWTFWEKNTKKFRKKHALINVESVHLECK